MPPGAFGLACGGGAYSVSGPVEAGFGEVSAMSGPVDSETRRLLEVGSSEGVGEVEFATV